MFDLSGLLDRAAALRYRPGRDAAWRQRPARPVRRGRLCLEELEDRVVPTLLGQQLYPADYPWNQNISSAPLAANSAAIIAHIGSSITVHPDWGDDSPSNGNSPLYGIPVNIVHGNSPNVSKVNVVIDEYGSESDIVPVPIPANAVIEGDYQNGPNPNGPGYGANQRGDSHLIIWDEDNNIAYELFGAARPSDPITMTGGPTGGVWHAAQETVWNMNTDSFRTLGDTSADAAGLSILAGLARPDEGLPIAQGGQGAIDHALRFTLPSGDVNPQYTYPASHVVSVAPGSTNLPFGARLRLMDTPAVNALIDNMGPEAQIIAHAMQQYGLVLADIGTAMYVTGTSASVDASNQISLTWDMNDVLGLEMLVAGDFQVVNLTPQVTGLSISSGTAGNTVTVSGQNFSGAAGRLSVLFGGAPASSVTYVDGGHITAVVPAGSGTVNVEVQSGIIATDPNNPTDNVNNPIFGYGTSVLSAVDLFTYVNTPISATNSSVTFASPLIGFGGADAVTVVVKDIAGHALSGLTSGAFSFGLSGGTSSGAFGPVTETAIKGTYTCTFMATTEGTVTALTATVDAVSLGSQPTITVSPGRTGPSGTIATDLPNFLWSLVPGAASYTLWLTDTSTSRTLVVPLLMATWWTPTQPLSLADKYTWWVGAVHGQTTTWNSGVTFRIAPTGSGPSGLVATTMPVFGWRTVIGAASYETWLTDTTTNRTSVITGLTATSWSPSQALTLGQNYKWWVAAVLGQTIAWDSALSFQIAPTGSGPSGTTVSAAPTFVWHAVTGAASYEIWLTDTTSNQTTVVRNLTATSWSLSQPLTLGHKYTWWVAAVLGQAVAWDSPLYFTISA